MPHVVAINPLVLITYIINLTLIADIRGATILAVKLAQFVQSEFM
jgi:hypothetical protein